MDTYLHSACQTELFSEWLFVDFKFRGEMKRFLFGSAGALNFFTSSLNTLCNKTMDDTLLTVKQYEAARYDFLPVPLTMMVL